MPLNMDNITSPSEIVETTRLKHGWDDGVFTSELLNKSVVPRNLTAAETKAKITPPKDAGKPEPLRTGTYRGTKLALTQMTKRIEGRYRRNVRSLRDMLTPDKI